MILYQNTLISLDIFKVCFICDLENCLGSCCVEGDAGAPLEVDEVNLLKENLSHVKPFMTVESLSLLGNNDFFVVNDRGEFETACIENRDCVFSYRHKGILRCSIETAYSKKKIGFKKPVSCHLYPVRLGKIKNELITVNYNEWSICKPAIIKGSNHYKPLFRFLKEPLIRRFGKEWYDELEQIYRELKDDKKL